MTTTQDFEDAFAAVGAVYEDRFTDFSGVSNYLLALRNAEVSAMQSEGVTEMDLPGTGDDATRNWIDDGFDYLQDVYRDVFAGSVAMGLKETVVSMKAAASALPPGATAGEKLGAYASIASQAAIGTAEDATRYLKGMAYYSYGFMGIGVAHKAITEGWDAGAQEAFKTAGTMIGMELTLLSLVKAKMHPILKVTYAASVGSLIGLTFEDYYDSVLSGIIQESIAEGWTQQELEDAIQAASKDYVDSKLDDVGGFFDDLLDGIEPIGGKLGDLGPENGWAPPLPGHVPGALVPWNQAPSTGSPLVLDLVGTGIDLTAFNATTTATFFDIDGDGFAEQTAWIGTGMGLLARDLNDNGTIDAVSELFGSPSVDGFALLATLDSNGDHVINQYDSNWSDLVVWVDANGDAFTQDGELHTLASLDIVSFDLAGVTASTSTIDGNPISHTSTYRLENGTTRSIVDAWFVHDNVNSSYAEEYTLDIDALSLPTLRGFGELPSLHIAMSQNEDLLELVQDFVSEWDISRFEDGTALDADIEEILFTWAGVESVSPTSRGDYIDARRLEFLETYFGNEFLQGGLYANPMANAAELLEDAWTQIYLHLKAHLIVQADDQFFGSTAAYNVWSGEIEGDRELVAGAIGNLEDAASVPGVDEEEFWIEVASFLNTVKGFENFTGTEDGWMDDAITATDPLLSWNDIKDIVIPDLSGSTQSGTSSADTMNGTAGNDNLFGANGNDTIYGDDGADILGGGDGDDTIYGGNGADEIEGDGGNDTLSPGLGANTVRGEAGDDTYVYGGGNDFYTEDGGSGTDTILLPSGIASGDLYFFRVLPETGNLFDNLSVQVGAVGTITAKALSSGRTALAASSSIETFTFSTAATQNLFDFSELDTFGSSGSDSINGVVIGSTEISDTIYGMEGDDTINGHGGDDILDGGSGNDALIGGAGNDIYIASPGFDTISESNSGTDTIRLPPGFDSGDVSFIRISSSPSALLITVSGLGQIAVSSHFSGTATSVEYLDSNGSSPISILSTSIETIGTSGNDNISGISSGASINDILDGGFGNDTLSGDSGDDRYYFSQGTDVINETSGTDVLAFRHGVLPEHIQIYRDGATNQTRNLMIADASGNTVSVSNHFYIGGSAIESIVFSDATTWTIASMEIETRGTSGNDVIYSYDNGDASSDDTVYGYAGNDTITGGNGNDILHGGDGADTLEGGSGNDTYFAGDGMDTVSEMSASGTDTLHIVGGATINDILVANSGTWHTKVTVDASVNEVLLNFYRQNSNYVVEFIRFDDGFLTTLSTYASWLLGSSGADIVAGNSSDNTLIGYAGDDTITGGDGNDDAHGGAGNDSIDGGNGNDLLYGGDGIDTLTYASATAGVTVNLATTTAQNTSGAGTDTVIGFENLFGSAYNDTLTGDGKANTMQGGAGNDTINGGGGTDTLTYAAATAGITINLATATGQNTGGAGTDTISNFENLIGSAYNDTLTGNGSANVIEGGAGNDAINGAGGTDTLTYADASAGITINLATATGQNTGGAGTDTISNFENLTGSAYNDTLTGNGSANVIEGGLGDDTINGAGGTDSLTYATATAGITMNLATATAQNTGGAGTDTVSNFENLTGSAFDDTLTGNGSANVIQGGDGNDTMNGAGGTDTLTYASATAAVTVSLATTAAQNTGGAGTDTISNFEKLTGSSFNDTLTGSTAANTISGGAGHDTLYGGSGNDTLTGGDGDDILYGEAGLDAMTGGAGADIYMFQAASAYSNIDSVSDFSTAHGDAINLVNLLTEYDPLTEAITDFVLFATSGSDTSVSVDRDGTGSTYGFSQIATLTGVTGLTDEATLVSNGNLIAA